MKLTEPIHRTIVEDLPEASFRWQPLDRLELPRPQQVLLPTLVRRVHRKARPLAARPRHEPDGWILGGPETGSVLRTVGPYIVSGGWWARPAHREYYFAETRHGTIHWIYYDRARRRWFEQGIVS